MSYHNIISYNGSAVPWCSEFGPLRLVLQSWALDSDFRVCMYFEPRSSNFELRTSNFALRASNFELRTSNFELRSSDFGLRPSNLELRTSNLELLELLEPRTSKSEVRSSKFGAPCSKSVVPFVPCSLHYNISYYTF